MQVIERFCAQASDGRTVEILKWGSPAAPSANVGTEDPAVYATLAGRRVTPTADDHYAIPALGITVRRQR